MLDVCTEPQIGFISTCWGQYDYLRSLDELVDRWLMGVDRRRLLEIAGKRLSTGSGKRDFRDLVVEWLDLGCLENLVTLVRASQDPFPVYPVCYALGKAFKRRI